MRSVDFPTHTLLCGPTNAQFDLTWKVQGTEGQELFTVYESLGAELTTREEIHRVLRDIAQKCTDTQRPIVWRINHIDAVSTVVAYILHSLMVHNYVTYQGTRYGGVPTQVVGITSNLAKVPRILMSAFHLQLSYDATGQLVRESFLERNPTLPAGTRGVYFLQAGESGRVKIGKTYDLAARIASLQTASPDTLTLLAFIDCTDADLTEVEAAMHRKFQQYRIQGEWFRQTEELLDFVRSLGTDSEAIIQDRQVIVHPRSEPAP